VRFQNLHDERLLEAQVEKENFHQFNSDFHKEKEMVDFRKWLLALAIVGLLLGVGTSTANAQGNSFTCAATAVPNIVRAEGVTELLGDLILNCTGGIPTAAGALIPLQNVVITVGGTNITSRLLDPTTGASEALLLIDEPYPAAPNPVGAPKDVTNPALIQLACLASNNTNCQITSTGVGLGNAGSYNGTAGHYNVFQGLQQGANSISWSGVPIDAPGTAGTRVIRITNIRANASLLAPGTTSLIPTTISESVFVNGFQVIALNQPSNGNVVGDIEQGLIPTVAFPGGYQQCNNVNTFLLTPPPPGAVTTDSGISVSAAEGFRYSFKPQNYAQVLSVQGGTYTGPGSPILQDVLNFAYSTESGFSPDATTPDNVLTGEEPGFADRGTQIRFLVSGVGAGVTLYAPSYVYLTGAYGLGTPVGVAVLVSQTASAGAVSASGIPVLLQGNAPAGPAPQLAVTSSGTTATLVYEIYYSDPSVLETLTVPISVEYISNTSSNLPAPTSPTSPATVTVGFNPLSTVPTATTGPIPRFVQLTPAAPLFSISLCSCNLLFPFVTNANGFNTGIAIANTSSDPYGTSPQAGTITLTYYGTTPSGTPPALYTTQAAVPAGTELLFDLLDGGSNPGGPAAIQVPATAGFEGYIIAQANFQYCHGFAFISDVQANKLAEGYLAISLDVPVVSVNPFLPTGLNRTGNGGENEGH
jgi:hypothetical protein